MPTSPKPELVEKQKNLVRDLLLLEYELREYRKLIEQPIDIDHRDNPAVSRWPKQLEWVETAIENVTRNSKEVHEEFLAATRHRAFWNFKRHSNDRSQEIKYTFDPNYLQPDESESDPGHATS